MTPEQKLAEKAALLEKEAIDNKEGIVATLVKAGLSSFTTNMIIGVSIDSALGFDANIEPPKEGEIKLSKKDNIENNSENLDKNNNKLSDKNIKADKYGEVIEGPKEGGKILDRPISGGLADQSVNKGVDLNYGDKNKISQSTPIDDKLLKVNGVKINPLEYIPGADYVKAATHNLNASDGLATLTHIVLKNKVAGEEEQKLYDKLSGTKETKQNGFSNNRKKIPINENEKNTEKNIEKNIEKISNNILPPKTNPNEISEEQRKINNKKYMEALNLQKETEDKNSISLKREY